MRVVYLDPGLVNESNHHANNCRAIGAAFRRHGHDVDIFAHHLIESALRAELGANPHFRLYPYQRIATQDIDKWHAIFLFGAKVFAQDVMRLGPFRSDMIVYVNSIQPAQLMGTCTALQSIPPRQRPTVFAEFGTEPGLDYVEDEKGGRFVSREPRVDPRAALYRYTSAHIRAAELTQLHLGTFDRTSSEIYSQLLGLPVRSLPVPRFASIKARRRGGEKPLTIGILGHQRRDKRYHLVPDIVRLVLGLRHDVHFLVHCADPLLVPAIQEQMRNLASLEPRITLDERAAGPEIWQGLLDQCDLIVCPYDPAAFRAGYSAITCEAMAHAIPLVVPASTTLSRTLDDFGQPGTVFSDDTVAGIVLAVYEALVHFDELADRAMRAAALWRETMGADAMVQTLLRPVMRPTKALQEA